MTDEEAVTLHLKWFGTAGIRKPPEDWQLRKHLGIDRTTWDEAETIVDRLKEERAGQTRVFICGRGAR